MALKRFSTLLLMLPMYPQTPPVSLAGVDLRPGMAKDGLLAKFAEMPAVKLSETGSNWYIVAVKRFDLWESIGD
jgi:hypothetical protein